MKYLPLPNFEKKPYKRVMYFDMVNNIRKNKINKIFK